MKEKQGQRLRDMAAAKRSVRIMELENELRGLEDLVQELDEMDEHEISSFLSNTVYSSRLEIESALQKVSQSLRKARGEPSDSEERVDVLSAEKFPLIGIPDEKLTPEQVYSYSCLFYKLHLCHWCDSARCSWLCYTLINIYCCGRILILDDRATLLH